MENKDIKGILNFLRGAEQLKNTLRTAHFKWTTRKHSGTYMAFVFNGDDVCRSILKY